MINHHLNRNQRRYLQKAVGAKKANESLTEKFKRIRENQTIGKQIHAANVESSYISNSEAYINPVAFEKVADEAVQTMIDHTIPLTGDSLLALNELGLAE